MSQSQQVLAYLKHGATINPIMALRHLGVMRLAARVKELRDSGHDIKTRIVESGGKKFAEYYL
jgi:hypothetical protein